MIPYPLKFIPILQERIWGGEKLVTQLNKAGSGHDLGESWELSAVKGNESIVANGPYQERGLQELLEHFKGELVGDRVYERFQDEFPLLIKFIDAKQDLSIQLHPNDALAKERHNSLGKTEMWYIMQAEENARLIMGFENEVNKETYQRHLEDNSLEDILRHEKVSTGDAFFIRTGTVHAIGGGIMLAEIQQSSDITYRLYDWNRTDKEGNPRELHTALALDAIDYSKATNLRADYHSASNVSNAMVSCPYFTTNFLPIEGNVVKAYDDLDSFVTYVCVEGEGALYAEGFVTPYQKGETVLIPASLKQVTIKSEASILLEVYID